MVIAKLGNVTEMPGLNIYQGFRSDLIGCPAPMVVLLIVSTINSKIKIEKQLKRQNWD